MTCKEDVHEIKKDTYMESVFYKKCVGSSIGDKLWSDWVYNKYQYTERTKTTIYEFMHYSKHDATHSINILKSIERILGKERIELLGLGDLWLLLSAAYAHDVGMSTVYEELEDLWKSEDFHKFLEKKAESPRGDMAKAVNHYKYLDEFIHWIHEENCTPSRSAKGLNHLKNSYGFIWTDYDSWPLEFRKEITLMMAEYIRIHHGQRSRSYFESLDRKNNILYIDRFYRMLGQIVSMHTEDQENIQNLRQNCNGFEDDDIHPQFVASLLRVGDLLDLDNNRFDVFAMEHFGTLPKISVAHYKKHQSVEHLLVHEDVIEVCTRSDDFEVCQISKSWLESLHREVIYLITHWKEMAPKELAGCRMGIPKLEVYHNSMLLCNDFISDFVLDQRKLLDLFTGNNLYPSNLDFIREYIQNAFDALKMQLWDDLDQEHKRNKYIKNRVCKEEMKPIDLNKSAYDDYPVNVRIKEYRNRQGWRDENKFVLEIVDNGIGIDKEGIDSISHIGSGWRKRENFTDIIRRMRQWVRPTGGFGIGMQSAFLMTDKVEIYTKAKNCPGYKITVLQDAEQNNILVEYDNSQSTTGTRIHLVIDLCMFDNEDKVLKRYGVKRDNLELFAYDDRLLLIWGIVVNYIQTNFRNTLFPIYIKVDVDNHHFFKRIQSQYFFSRQQETPEYMSYREIEDSSRKQKGIYETGKYEALHIFLDTLKISDKSYKKAYLSLDEEEGSIRFWNDETEVFYYLKLSHSGKYEMIANYKNVTVLDDSRKYEDGDEHHTGYPHLMDCMVDVMGMKVKECLVVSRNKFLEKVFEDKFTLTACKKAYLAMYWNLVKNNLIDTEISILFKCLLIFEEKLEQDVYDRFQIKAESDGLLVQKIHGQDGVIDEYPQQEQSYNLLIDAWNKGDVTMAFPALEGDINCAVLSDGDNNCEYWVLEDEKTKEVTAAFKEQGSRNIIKRPQLQPEYSDKVKWKALWVLNSNPSDYKAVGKGSDGDILIYEPCRSHGEIGSSGRAIARDDIKVMDGGVYAPLVVNKLPFTKKDGTLYIISPFNRTVDSVLNRMRAFRTDYSGKSTISNDEIVGIVVADASYEKLCQWVYANQREQDKYSLEDIKEAYVKYICEES